MPTTNDSAGEGRATRQGWLLEVRIDRSRWLRGAPSGSTLRHPKSRHECPVGTIGRTAGIACRTLERYSHLGALAESDIPAVLHEFSPTLSGLTRAPDPRQADAPKANPKPVASLMYSVNDDAALDDPTRERLLAELAATIGIRLWFTGAPLPRHAAPPTGDGRTGQLAISVSGSSGHAPRRMRLATMVLDDDHRWQPLEATSVTLDADPETTHAYVWDLVRSHAHEQPHPVRVTATETGTGRTVADAYHEPV